MPSLVPAAEPEAGASGLDLLPGCSTVFAPSLPTHSPSVYTPASCFGTFLPLEHLPLVRLFEPGFNYFPDPHHFGTHLPSLGPAPVCRFLSGQALAAFALPGTRGFINAG